MMMKKLIVVGFIATLSSLSYADDIPEESFKNTVKDHAVHVAHSVKEQAAYAARSVGDLLRVVRIFAKFGVGFTGLMTGIYGVTHISYEAQEAAKHYHKNGGLLSQSAYNVSNPLKYFGGCNQVNCFEYFDNASIVGGLGLSFFSGYMIFDGFVDMMQFIRQLRAENKQESK